MSATQARSTSCAPVIRKRCAPRRGSVVGGGGRARRDLLPSSATRAGPGTTRAPRASASRGTAARRGSRRDSCACTRPLKPCAACWHKPGRDVAQHGARAQLAVRRGAGVVGGHHGFSRERRAAIAPPSCACARLFQLRMLVQTRSLRSPPAASPRARAQGPARRAARATAPPSPLPLARLRTPRFAIRPHNRTTAFIRPERHRGVARLGLELWATHTVACSGPMLRLAAVERSLAVLHERTRAASMQLHAKAAGQLGKHYHRDNRVAGTLRLSGSQYRRPAATGSHRWCQSSVCMQHAAQLAADQRSVYTIELM